ncbi:HET-domain-containing protein [Ophiobolus disseminans]|uniref:HET-domain-containing protein n=1 Tax=Ophiobolus disseminans TaxID=1469910 RepID=A0A6A7A6T8_9PLEO|nr:HET-domain-containing protein [Ophiobolus disseminans]
MILIDTRTLALQEFQNSDQRYAILSHTWGPAGEEVTYDEMMAPERSAATRFKPGYDKIVKTCEIALANYKLPYAWVDTCCINKASSAELSEAINSMFRWYKDAWVGFAYISDMTERASSFHQSRWFSRGWTLQELIAPKDLIFFDRNWEFRGTRESRAGDISTITGIPTSVLHQYVELSEIPIAQRFSWASTRETTRVEDRAYSLLGIFDINMAMMYGEGQKAFIRLQEHILSQSADLSIFLWTDLETNQKHTGLFAPSPACFIEMRKVVAEPTFTQREFFLTNRGIRLKLGLTWDTETGLAILPVKHLFGASDKPAGIYLRRVGQDLFVRAHPQICPTVDAEKVYAVFTAAKTLTDFQSKSVAHNVIGLTIPQEVTVTRVEPNGSWDPSRHLLHAGHTNAFLGYMVFQLDLSLFAIVFCFRSGRWSAAAISRDRWPAVQESFYNYYQSYANLAELKYNDTMPGARMASLKGPHSTAMVVYMRGGHAQPHPFIELQFIDQEDSLPPYMQQVTNDKVE